MTVQRFLCKHLALFQDEFIQMGQSGRIETDGVFHQQDDLYRRVQVRTVCPQDRIDHSFCAGIVRVE